MVLQKDSGTGTCINDNEVVHKMTNKKKYLLLNLVHRCMIYSVYFLMAGTSRELASPNRCF